PSISEIRTDSIDGAGARTPDVSVLDLEILHALLVHSRPLHLLPGDIGNLQGQFLLSRSTDVDVLAQIGIRVVAGDRLAEAYSLVGTRSMDEDG
ncbi:hypothetical protein PMAYCL1PPCAC_15379, partial [Pristionchus mayeri]